MHKKNASSLKTGQIQCCTAELIQSPVLNDSWLSAPHTSTPSSSSTWCDWTAPGAGRCCWGQITLMRWRGGLRRTQTRVGIKTCGGYNQRCIIHSQWLLQLLKQWPSSYNLILLHSCLCVCVCVCVCVCSIHSDAIILWKHHRGGGDGALSDFVTSVLSFLTGFFFFLASQMFSCEERRLVCVGGGGGGGGVYWEQLPLFALNQSRDITSLPPPSLLPPPQRLQPSLFH